jgi:hypothetical protein
MTDQAPVLVLIGADPRQSHRANAALRIALGIVSGENDVVVVLRGPAAHLLDEDTDALVDGDDIAKFRANLRTAGVPLHVEAASRPPEPDWNADGHPVVLATPADIVALMRASRRVLIF